MSDEALAREAERILTGWQCRDCRHCLKRPAFRIAVCACFYKRPRIEETYLTKQACEHFELPFGLFDATRRGL